MKKFNYLQTKFRDKPIAYMDQIEQKKSDCSDCTGMCCTFERNSMQITPLEAYELLIYIKENDLWDIEKLKANIKNFRLDQFISTKKNSFIRRSYTCPFFSDSPLACLIAPESKPLGCLTYNSKGSGVKNGENCATNVNLLEEATKELDLTNQKFCHENNIEWSKLSIPIALIEIYNHFDA